jgi:predicted GIY-YIG superfamily endonuclease
MGYEKSKIYKVQCSDGYFYIGSSYNTLAKRLGQHKGKALRRPEQRLYKHINGDWTGVRMVLIEDYPCENKEQLTQREDEHIQKERNNPLCLNCKGSVLNVEARAEYNKAYLRDYYEKNKEQMKLKQQEYYEKNKEAFIRRSKERRERIKNQVTS